MGCKKFELEEFECGQTYTGPVLGSRRNQIALKTRRCRVRASEELGVRTDGPQLVLPKAAQIFLIDPLFSEKSTQDKIELRVPIVVLANRAPYGFGSGNIPGPTDLPAPRSGRLSALLPESLPGARAPEQRRREVRNVQTVCPIEIGLLSANN